MHRDELLHSLAGELEKLARRTGDAPSQSSRDPQALAKLVVMTKSGEKRRPLLLVAEDNATNRMVVERQLTFLGVRADFAPDGEAALELWSRADYDLVLTDCHMPKMDGFDLTRAIRSAEHDTARHVPIIALTANAMVGESERCLNAGMDDYLAKPVTLVQIRDVLLRWIESGAESEQAISDVRDDFAATSAFKNAESGVRPGNPVVAERTAPVPTAPVESSDGYRLPRPLPGIDLEEGLQRMLGDEAFFRDMLLDCLRDFVDAVTDVENSLAQGLRTEAQMRVHAIRGVAASLAAVELSRSAQAVERAGSHACTTFDATMRARRVCCHRALASDRRDVDKSWLVGDAKRSGGGRATSRRQLRPRRHLFSELA